MATPSDAFTAQDIQGFVTDYLEQEKRHLIARLRTISDQVTSLAGQVTPGDGAQEGWDALEVLAHMATSSQYFGWMTSKVLKGEGTGEILQMLRMRDTVNAQAAAQGAEKLTAQLSENLERTIALVESTEPMDLRKTFDYVGMPMSAEDLVRIPLCAHLETHIEQMKERLHLS